jgi:hypothetical protein
VAIPERSDGIGPEPAAAPPADARSSSANLLSPSSLRSAGRRTASVVVLAAIDVVGLVIGLYGALALRAAVVDPKPILWGFLWDQAWDWLPFLILVLLLVFWRGGLYGPREVREGVGRIVPSVFLVAALSLAFALGTGQHVPSFGLNIVGAVVA